MIIKQAVFMTFLVAYPEQARSHATGNRLPRTPRTGDHSAHRVSWRQRYESSPGQCGLPA
jgi:hypothetical protein